MKLKGMVNMALISLFIIAAGYNVYRSQKNINFTLIPQHYYKIFFLST